MNAKHFTVIILSVFLISAASVCAAADDVFVFSLQGPVSVETGDEAARPLSAGEFITSGDTIRTGTGGMVTLIFPDDSQMTVTSGKTVAVGGGEISGKSKGLRDLWRRITGKHDDAEYAVSFGTVGAVRGEEDLPPENWPLYDDEAEELAGELEAIEKQFPDGGNRFLLSAVVLEEFEQFAEAERMYTLALDNLPETPYFYDLVIDFYLKAEQYAKAEELWERKELSAVGD